MKLDGDSGGHDFKTCAEPPPGDATNATREPADAATVTGPIAAPGDYKSDGPELLTIAARRT